MNIGVVTDAHLRPPRTPPDGCHNHYAFARADAIVVSALTDHRQDAVAAIAVLGDLGNSEEVASLPTANGFITEVKLPVWIVSDRHDQDSDRFVALVRSIGAGFGWQI